VKQTSRAGPASNHERNAFMRIHNDASKIRELLEEQNKEVVSVALFGQPGAGKSSLINKIVGAKVAQTGVETDKTVEEASYLHKGLRLVDLPGYGTAKFPKQGYKEKFHLEKFDLFLCVTSGKFHQADTELFRELEAMNKVCIFVVNKHDELWEDDIPVAKLMQRKKADIVKQLGKDVNIVFTSCRNDFGLAELTDAILANLNAAKRDRWVRGAQAYSLEFLKEKRAVADRYVAIAAAASAANGLNPIPGADIAIDMSVLVKLFQELRQNFGLDDSLLGTLKESTVPAVSTLANNIVRYAAKEGVLLLLKQFVGKQVIKTIAKYIPIIGQAVAATTGFAITYSAGKSYLKDCHELAEKILQDSLKN
jgi:small GTP-binding protein